MPGTAVSRIKESPKKTCGVARIEVYGMIIMKMCVDFMIQFKPYRMENRIVETRLTMQVEM